MLEVLDGLANTRRFDAGRRVVRPQAGIASSSAFREWKSCIFYYLFALKAVILVAVLTESWKIPICIAVLSLMVVLLYYVPPIPNRTRYWLLVRRPNTDLERQTKP